MIKRNVVIQHLTFSPGSHPTVVHVTIADSPSAENATVWIEARFPLKGRSDDKLAVLALGVLAQLQTLIEEGKEAAQAPPSGTA